MTIVIIDPDERSRVLTEAILVQHDFTVMGTGKDLYSALVLLEEYQPDIAIIDMDLNQNRIDPIPLLKSKSPDTDLILFTSIEKDDQICRAVKGEILGYLLKNTDLVDLVEIIKNIHQGGTYINPRITQKSHMMLSEIICRKRLPEICGEIKMLPSAASVALSKLSRIEFQIIQYIIDDYSTKEIAKLLNLSAGTVRNYISSAMKKLGVENRVQLVRYAFANGLIPINEYVPLKS